MKSRVYNLKTPSKDPLGFRLQKLICVIVFAVTSTLSTNVQADVVVGGLDYNNQFSGRTQTGAAAMGNAGDIWNGSASFGGFVGTETPSGNTGATAPFGAFELLDPAGAASGVSYQMTFINDGVGFNSAFDAAGSKWGDILLFDKPNRLVRIRGCPELPEPPLEMFVTTFSIVATPATLSFIKTVTTVLSLNC